MQLLAFIGNPVLPKIIQTYQPNATLWAAAPAVTSNTSWAINMLLADFSIALEPPVAGFTPISFNFFNTTLWCAASYEEADPLIALAIVNGFAPPMLSFGPGPGEGGAGSGGGLGDAEGLPEASPVRTPERGAALSQQATEMTAVSLAPGGGEDGGGNGEETQPWLVALIAILTACVLPGASALWLNPISKTRSSAAFVFVLLQVEPAT